MDPEEPLTNVRGSVSSRQPLTEHRTLVSGFGSCYFPSRSGWLQIDLEILFHADGYKGSAQSIIENFQQGRYFGVPLLHTWGIADKDCYPAMLPWVR